MFWNKKVTPCQELVEPWLSVVCFSDGPAATLVGIDCWNELETFLAQLNDLADKHQVVVTSTEPGAVELLCLWLRLIPAVLRILLLAIRC